MLLKRLLNFFLGYCDIIVEGPRKERFINLAINEGIDLWDIIQDGETRVWTRVAVTDIKRLRHIARKSHCPFKIAAKKGFPFMVVRAERRKGLALGAVLFMISLYWLASFVWFVDVHSTEPLKNLTQEKILEEAAGLGLRPGRAKYRLDLTTIEHNLAINLPQLTFVSIEMQGTLAKIEVVEKKVVDEKNKTKPAHIIAAKDGVIGEILVLVGEPRVKEEDTVQKGQVLISGIVSPRGLNPETGESIILEGPPATLEAKGVVRARVWYEATTQAPIIETSKKPTGAKSEQWSVRIGSKNLIIRGPKAPPYPYFKQEQQTRTLKAGRNLDLPVEVLLTTYYELKPFRRDWGVEGATNNAKQAALDELNSQIPPDARRVDQKMEIVEQNNSIAKVRVWVETMEEIGQKQYLEP